MQIGFKNKEKPLERGAGILLPISSLPSPYGIGTLGKEAYRFVNQLAEAGQKYWQVLPVGPTSYGDSPYQSFSAFAGNPYFIDLDLLVEEGLLTKEEILKECEQSDGQEERVNYSFLFEHRFAILRKAFERSAHQKKMAYRAFLAKNRYWIEDYALFMALKYYYGQKPWTDWEDEDIRFHTREAVTYYGSKLKTDVDFWKFCQYEFFKQWNTLKRYAVSKNISIIGDIPLYVSMDSADVWAHSVLFELDERKKPIHIAGVPPDCFSADGQRWGNPLYQWKAMASNHYRWWAKRMKASAALYDVIRIDHFIGIVNYWSIPAECETAVDGCWRKGPGKHLTKVIKASVGNSNIIAEDLGIVGPEVRALINQTGWPGMKILEFAFDSGAENEYLPHNYKSPNCIVYGGTHDNETLAGFYGEKSEEELQFLYQYLGISEKKDIPWAIIRLGYASTACVAISQMQDILELDNSARMNFPSTLGNNWQWRLKKGQFGKTEIAKLLQFTEMYNR